MHHNNFSWNNSNRHQYPPQPNYSIPPPPFIPQHNDSQRMPQRLPNRFQQPITGSIPNHSPSFAPQVNFQLPPPPLRQTPINLQRPPPPLTHIGNLSNQPPPHHAVPFPPNNPIPNYNNTNLSSCNVNPTRFQLPSHVPPYSSEDISIPTMKGQGNSFSNIQQSHQIFQPETLSTNSDEYLPELEKKRKIGEGRLNDWLQRVRKLKLKGKQETKTLSCTPNLKINDFIQQLQSSFTILTELANQANKMQEMISEADRSVWQEECIRVEQMKEQHFNLQNTVNERRIKEMQLKLKKIKNKKRQRKRAAQVKVEERHEIETNRLVKEKEIDDWQNKLRNDMKEENLKKKRKLEMDRSLSEITKKINDANRLIETMTALQKLRLIRQDAAMKRGDVDLGEPRENFEQKISDMTRLVRSQLEVYKEEEKSIRTVILSEQDATNEKERKLQQEKDKEREQQRDNDLYNKLFGNTGDAGGTDPLFPFQQFYKQAQASLPALLQIRHEWDQFLVPPDDPLGSCIPQHWVQPTDPSNNEWAKCLV